MLNSNMRKRTRKEWVMVLADGDGGEAITSAGFPPSRDTLEAFDRFEAYRADGALSAPSWLRHRCNVSYSSASHQVQLARRLPELPHARAAFAAGDLSSAHVSLMTGTADQVDLEPVQEQEPVLVEAARQLDPRTFRHVTQHLRHCLDPDGTSYKGMSALQSRSRRGE
jgi:hypothetical protein